MMGKKTNITKIKEEIVVLEANYLENVAKMNLAEVKQEIRRQQSNKCNYSKEGKIELLAVALAKEQIAKERRAELDGQRSKSTAYNGNIDAMTDTEVIAFVKLLQSMISRRKRNVNGHDPEDIAFLEKRLAAGIAKRDASKKLEKKVISNLELDEYINTLRRAIDNPDTSKADKKRYQVAVATLEAIRK
jgi:hypothetical protein